MHSCHTVVFVTTWQYGSPHLNCSTPETRVQGTLAQIARGPGSPCPVSARISRPIRGVIYVTDDADRLRRGQRYLKVSSPGMTLRSKTPAAPSKTSTGPAIRSPPAPWLAKLACPAAGSTTRPICERRSSLAPGPIGARPVEDACGPTSHLRLPTPASGQCTRRDHTPSR